MLPLLASKFDPVSEFTQFISDPYVNLPGPFDINKAVLYMWLSAAVIVIGVLVLVRRGLVVRPDGRQTAVETVYDLAYTQIAKAGLPEEGMRTWFPYVATLFERCTKPVYFALADEFQRSTLDAMVMDSRRLRSLTLRALLDANAHRSENRPGVMPSH